MELLTSNIPPLKTKNDSFYDKFYCLLDKSFLVTACTGFITKDSLAELKQLIQINKRPQLRLAIGMHYFTGFEKSQYDAALSLNRNLATYNNGSVVVSTQFPYHGKLYAFFNRDLEPFAAIVGSNNLGSIVQTTNRVYEVSLLVQEKPMLEELNSFIDAFLRTCTPIEQIEPRIVANPPPLEQTEGVVCARQDEYQSRRTVASGPQFEIPLKADPERQGKSNLNVYFGKGRLNTSTGIEIPRPWFEVELFVPKVITIRPGYPNPELNNGIFKVITDDGWIFNCKVSGDYSKNFRSEGDLSILGRWIKGRLENAGVLTPGDVITNDMLQEYGRNTMELTYSGEGNSWLLDFGQRNTHLTAG